MSLPPVPFSYVWCPHCANVRRRPHEYACDVPASAECRDACVRTLHASPQVESFRRDHEKRDHRCSLRIRAGNHDEGRRGADLSDRRLCVRQCGAWRGAVQSRGRGLSLRPHQQPHDRRAGAPRRRAGRRRRGAVREHRPGCAELCFAQRHRTRLQHRVGAATLRNHHTLFAHVFPRQGVSVRFAAGISRPTSRS